MLFNRLKLREKMMVSILGINLVMLILILVAFTGYSRRVVVHQTQMRAMEKMRGVAATLEGFLNEKAKIAGTFCEMREIKSWLASNTNRQGDAARDRRFASIQDHLRRFVTQDGQIKTAFVASERTQSYYDNTDRDIPDDYRVGTRSWYKDAVAAGKGVFDVNIDYIDQSVSVNYRHPIYNDQDKLLGVGGVDIAMDRFQSYLEQLNDVFETGVVFLVDDEGMLLAHPNPEWVLQKKLADFTQEDGGNQGMEAVIDRVASQESGIDALRFENEDRYFIATPIPKLGWTLILAVTTAEVNHPVRTLVQASVIIVLVTALLLTAGIVWLTRSVTRPILHVVGMFRDISQGRGDLTRRIEVESEDEIGELADGFNQFMDRLHQILLEVKENAERIAGTTGNVSTTATQLAAGAEEQNAQAAEVASSIQEMAAVMVQNAQSAKATATIAEKATAKASEGTAVMQITQDGMDGIVQASNRTGQIVETMAGRTLQIGEIIRVIDDIAVQTKPLGPERGHRGLQRWRTRQRVRRGGRRGPAIGHPNQEGHQGGGEDHSGDPERHSPGGPGHVRVSGGGGPGAPGHHRDRDGFSGDRCGRGTGHGHGQADRHGLGGAAPERPGDLFQRGGHHQRHRRVGKGRGTNGRLGQGAGTADRRLAAVGGPVQAQRGRGGFVHECVIRGRGPAPRGSGPSP